LQRTFKYASLLRILGALHLGLFEQPAKSDIFNKVQGPKVPFPLSLWENELKLASACIMEYIKVGKERKVREGGGC
jgi:hypothetical protein